MIYPDPHRPLGAGAGAKENGILDRVYDAASSNVGIEDDVVADNRGA